MRAVVADTGPLNYLVLIDQVLLLPRLFDTVFVPEVVRAELEHSEAPPIVRQWIAAPLPWLEVRPHAASWDVGLDTLDPGERGAIMLALSLGVDMILMDDRAGVAIARAKGFTVTGTLGLLDFAARQGLVKLEDAFAQLRTTGFYCHADLFEKLLAQHGKEADED